MLLVPILSIEPDNDKYLQCNSMDKYIEVFPLYRSPNINCLCPLPTGNILSTIRNPVINESLTFDLKDILTPLFNKL